MVWEAGAPDAGFSTADHTWLPIREAHARRAVDTQAGEDTVLGFYRRMISTRRSLPELRTGRTRFFDLPHPTLAFLRGETAFCVFNLSPERVELRLTGEVADRIAEAADHSDGRLSLGPNGFLIGAASPRVEVGAP